MFLYEKNYIISDEKMNEMERFLENYKQRSTYLGYKSHLNKFFRAIKQNPDFYFKRKRNYTKDVQKYWSELMDSGTPALNIRNALSVVKQYLEENDIIIPKRVWRNLRNRTKGSLPLTQDRIPTTSDLKKILSYATAKDRAIFLLSASSGMRIKEILFLKPEDINLETNTAYIKGIYTKSGNPRISFFTDETKDALKSWKNIREQYLEKAYRKSRNKYKDGKKIFATNKKSDRLFPFTYSPTRRAWIKLIEQAGYNQKDSTTGLYIYHIHCLRKFMKTRLLSVGIEEIKINMIIGHQTYLGNSYVKFSEDELRAAYQKGMKALLVFETSPDLTDVNKEIAELRKENEQLRKDMQSLMVRVLAQDDKNKT